MIYLKPGKEKSLKQKHHWVFSGALQEVPNLSPGEMAKVFSAKKELLGTGYFNPHGSIAFRMVAFGSQDPIESIKTQIKQAIALRKTLFTSPSTNAYRLINGEGDGLPGLVVDQYDQVLVVQVTTQGMEKLLPTIIDLLIQEIRPTTILEKSTGPARRQEGLKDQQRVLHGPPADLVTIQENGLSFRVSLLKGQKTGFFLDQREMRLKVRELAKGKRLLNCFSYTGGFSISASQGGALSIDSVDISEEAIALAKENAILNHQINHRFFVEDVFSYLRKPLDYDFIILDPPAFAKKKGDVIAACKGYKEINREALKNLPSHSLLLTSSCSYHIDETLFQQVLFQAALEANRTVSIIGRHIQAPDHTLNIYHPEGDYLKSLLLFIN